MSPTATAEASVRVTALPEIDTGLVPARATALSFTSTVNALAAGTEPVSSGSL